MTPGAFYAWRLRNNISQYKAAELLNRNRRTIQRYEKGAEHLGRLVVIPKEIRLAMWAIEQGKLDWDGH